MSILTPLPGAALMPAGPPGPQGAPGADSTVPGPKGDQGPPGGIGPAGAGALISRTATATIPAWTAIVADGAGGCRPADPSNPAQRQQVIAVTAYGGANGTAVTGQNTGDILGPNVGFVPGTTLFVGAGGGLAPTPPTSGWRQAVATVIADGHVVVALGEASIIAADVPLIAASGFSTPASAADVVAGQNGSRFVTPAALFPALSGKADAADVPAQAGPGPAVAGQGDGVYASPADVGRHVRTRVGVSPYDYIADPAVQDAIRTGVNAPASDAAIQMWLDGWTAGAGDCGSSATLPAGTWVLDQVHEVMLASPGRNRRYHLHLSPGAKLVPGPNNRFRFAVQGEWDAASSPGLLTASSGMIGDAWVVVSPNNALSLNGITNVNVGDQVYKGANGWQKILCRARYRYQFWDASTNTDDKGNLVILPSIGDEYDCFIVGKAGNSNIDGISSWDQGDEAIYLRGRWRKKKVQGGTFRGIWNANTNTPTLSNSNGAPGDWYIVGGSGPTIAPIDIGNGNRTGLGEFITTVPGEKIWCVAPGRWEKCYASPLFRGAWAPATDLRRQQWYPTQAPNGTVNSVIGTTWAEAPLAGQGAYGDAYEITRPGNGTVGGISRSWQRGEYAYYGANGWEVIRQDPNWSHGLFRFVHDDKTSLVITGRMQIASRAQASLLSEWSEGIYIRNHALSRPDYANYLYQGVMLSVQEVVVAGDDANAGIAQGDCGICEGVWEVRNLYLPLFSRFDGLFPARPAAQRRLEELNTPRMLRFGIRHIDSYVPMCNDFMANGGLLRGYCVESDVWSVEQSSWEGGYLRIAGANMMTAAYIGHGLRAMPALFEPTFRIVSGDLGYSRYGIQIQGHQGVEIDVGRPIMPGVGGSDPMIEQPAFVLVEDCGGVRITNGVPTAGSYQDSEHFGALLRTRGNVSDVTLSGIDLHEISGVVLNLRHNSNAPSQISAGYIGSEYRVSVSGITGYSADTATKKFYYNSDTKRLAKGMTWTLPPEINLGSFPRATDNSSAAAAGVVVGGTYLHTSNNGLFVRTA